MQVQRIFCGSEEDTVRLGESFAERLKGGEVICLLGDLGSGKTTFVKGLAKGLEIEEGYQVRSPTFTIVNEYPIKRGKLIHIDLYRLETFEVEQFLEDALVVIEWAKDLSLCDYVLEFGFEGEGRTITIKRC